MTTDDLRTLSALLADRSAAPSPEWTDDMARRFPWFTLPALLELERLPAAARDRRAALTARVALNSASADRLYALLEPMAAGIDSLYPPESGPVTPTTDSAIDTFMTTYGTPDPAEDALLERLIFNPQPDYSQLLAEEAERDMPAPEEAAGSSHDSLINAFIIKSRDAGGHFPQADPAGEPVAATPRPATPASTPQPPPQPAPDDSLLSESLAKIYIRRGRYEKAFEIINTLNLKYPEKSVYFANRIEKIKAKINNNE